MFYYKLSFSLCEPDQRLFCPELGKLDGHSMNSGRRRRRRLVGVRHADGEIGEAGDCNVVSLRQGTAGYIKD